VYTDVPVVNTSLQIT